jgi:cell division protein FtsL
LKSVKKLLIKNKNKNKMGKYFALSMQIPMQQTKKRTASKASVERLGFAVTALCLILMVSYFVQANSFSTKGFEISKLQQQVDDLAESNKKLQIEAAELQSLQRIQSEPQVTGMVPVNTVTYVQTSALSSR